MKFKRTTIYISEELHKDVKDFLVDDEEFKTISEMVSTLLSRYIDKKEVLSESKFLQMEKDLKATNRNSRILLQQITTLLKTQDSVPTELYKDSYFYKKSVELIDEEFINQKMNPTSTKNIKENTQSADDMYKNLYR